MPYYPPAASSGLATTGGTMTGTITSTLGTITANTPMITGTQTWNASGVAFKGIQLSVTNTASAAASRLLDLLVGGSTMFAVDVGGAITRCAGMTIPNGAGNINAGNNRIQTTGPVEDPGGGWQLSLAGSITGGLNLGNNRGIGWSSTTSWAGSGDLGLHRNAAGVLEVNNGTAGTFRDLKLRDLIATAALNVQGASASVGSGISIGGATRTTVGAAGGASALPATPTGYLDWYVGSTAVGIPYFARGA
jgi:hypothetical protein